MKQEFISIIIPVYKTEESHLRRAIESVIKQSYREIEIILVDDGSPDQSGVICDSYASIDKGIHSKQELQCYLSQSKLIEQLICKPTLLLLL